MHTSHKRDEVGSTPTTTTMNPDIVIYAGNPVFESLKMDKMMEALRDRTVKIPFGNSETTEKLMAFIAEEACKESEAEEEIKKRRTRRKLKYRSIDDKFEVSVD